MPLGEAAAWLAADTNRERGEFVLIVDAPGAAAIATVVPADAAAWLDALARELPPARAARIVAAANRRAPRRPLRARPRARKRQGRLTPVKAPGRAGADTRAMATTKRTQGAAGQAVAPLAFDPALVRKYDQSGPRYTSYPTADRFHEAFGARGLRACADHAPRRRGRASRCRCTCTCRSATRCASTARATRWSPRTTGAAPSTSATWRARSRRSRRSSSPTAQAAPVEQVHLGGGTPTFLARDEMRALMGTLRGRVPVRARRRGLDRGRPAQGRRRRDRVPRVARLQPHLGGRAGLRPGGAEGGQPAAERGRDAHRDRRPRARTASRRSTPT